MLDSRGLEYGGLLVIGDPHLEGRQPGFRKDDYPHVILEKLAWCLDYAEQHALLPAIPGDLFDKPRDNPTWMLGNLIEMFRFTTVIAVYGNHDCAEPRLTEHDSLSLLIKAGCIQLIDSDQPWRGSMGGRTVIVGGSSYREPIPDEYGIADDDGTPLVVWLAHHDITVPGYEHLGRLKPREIDQIDVVINGHIHRRLEQVRVGRTLWLTPGNISRRKRSEASRQHVPSALRLDIGADGFDWTMVEVPHQPFREVFHEAVLDELVDPAESAFVKGLAELQARRTDSGAGFTEFLRANLDQFDKDVAKEVMTLAEEVTADGESEP